MLDITTATEDEIDPKAAGETPAPDHALRDQFEAIWRIAGLPPGDLNRHPDGSYKGSHAAQAWNTYAATRDWHAVLGAAKLRG